MLIIAAILLVGLSLWVHLGGSPTEFQVPALSAAALAAMKPDLEGDMQLITELRRQVGSDPDAWKNLPPAGQAVFATLFAEEVHRTTTWGQMTEGDPVALGIPPFDAIADAYRELGCTAQVTAIRTLQQQFDADRIRVQAWLPKPGEAPTGPHPPVRATEAAAHAAFAHLDAVRQTRLAFVRSHASELGIR